MIDDDTFNVEDINESVHNIIADNEIENTQAIVALAVDTTLRYVVEWLHERGNIGPAEVLESIGEL